MNTQSNLYNYVKVLLSLAVVFSTAMLFAEDPAPAGSAQPEVELKVSKEAIASLSAQLSAEQFALVESKLIGQPFTQLDLSVLIPTETPPTTTETTTTPVETMTAALAEATTETAEASSAGKTEFPPEILEKITTSLTAYHTTLVKIQRVAPLIHAAHELKLKIDTQESTLSSLQKAEKDVAEKEIAQLKTQQHGYLDTFNKIAHEMELESINFDKLPGMLTDLGYENTFYEIIYVYLSDYIGLIKKVETAKSIISSLVEVEKDIEAAEKTLKAAQTPEEKASITEQLKKIFERQASLKHDFTLTSTGIDATALADNKNKKIDANEELTKVFSPLIVGLTEFTEPARRTEFLRSSIASYEQQLPQIHKGIEQIEVLLNESNDESVKKSLAAEKDYWIKQEEELSAKLEVAKQQLLDLQTHKLSASEAFNQFVQAIFSKRGLSIVFSFLVFIGVMVGLLIFRRLVQLINPFSYLPKFRFIANMIDVFLYFMTFIISILAMLVYLFATGEVLVMGLIVIILFGLGWTLRNALPIFVEQIKLLLGYGTVRQGERVIHNNIAWRVESIGIYSYLHNPLLTGGTVRLPIKDLIDLRSRKSGEGESWFPCKEGDYILLNQKDWRKVITQTPQRIKLGHLSMEETMPAEEFLRQKIINLSDTPFWVSANLYIAYDHRLKVVDEITAQMVAFLEQEFKQLPFGDLLLLPWVKFAEMTNTSLGLWVMVQVSAEAAAKYNVIKLNLTQICLKAANEYGWEIRRFNFIQQPHLEALPSHFS